MQGYRTEGYEGCKYKDARLKDAKDRECRIVEIPRSLVAPLRGAGGYIYIYIYIYIQYLPLRPTALGLFFRAPLS